jgi:phage/plasmid-associated DNA primase
VCNVGGGENGKSAIMLGVLRGVGTYGALISHQVLLAQPGQHTTELMDLRGLRFALLEETPEEGRLDTHRLKQTIGAVKIRARRMRKDPVEFAPTHSLWINTNFPPQVDTTDHGTWRRLKAMPWVSRFLKPGQQLTEANDRVGDLTLKSRLALTEDVPAAVIAWMVAGAMAWYQNNRMMPPDPELVVEATSGWRQTSDVGYRFAMERLAPGYRSPEVSYFITAETMRAEFTAFLSAEGKAIWSSQLINNRLGPSMLAAGITTSKDPSKASKVREGDVESRPERPAVVLPNGQVAPALRDAAPVPPGKTCRLWRGVRFKTERKMREDTNHLKVV